MISIVAMVLGLMLIGLLWQWQRPAFIAAFIIVFSLSYRIVDVAYLDLFGPIYATELDHHVGGNLAAPMFVFACACFLVPLMLIASRKRLLKGIEDPVPINAYLVFAHHAALAACGGVIVFLYLDMVRIGVIPLFVGMDRLQYEFIAGYLHNYAYEMNFLLSAALGVFTVLPRLQGGRYSLSFLALALGLAFYWALTGNRFSAFLVTGSYYALPFAAVVAMQHKGILRRIGGRDAWSALLSSRVLVPIALIGIVGALTGLVINSYYEVRNYADPTYEISQRILVQPVQSWASTWDVVSMTPEIRPNHDAIDAVLINPEDPYGNTTMRYLMQFELGYHRANDLLDHGQQYAGGYPEIFFHLFGGWLALPLMMILGTAAAFLLYLAIRSLCQGKPITAIMAVYVYFGFSIAYIGGMLNFLLVWTFGLKIIALIIFAIAESYMIRRHRPGNALYTGAMAAPGSLPRIA